MARPTRLQINLMLMAVTPCLAQAPLPIFETRWTAEVWRLPTQGERHMGVLGLQVDQRWPSGAYAGFGGWGSLTGDRGGFITMGMGGGWRLPLTGPLGLDAGLWVGGGGVGRASVGGGLMLRGHTGLSWTTSQGRYVLEWSRVRFPNGEIDTRQVALSAAFPFRLPAWTLAPPGPASWPDLGHYRDVSISLTAQRYAPTRSTHNLAGQPDSAPLDLGGLEARLGLDHRTFIVLDSSAAARGKAAGYMDVFLGLGTSVDLVDSGRLRATGKLVGGAAGGGHLDVGGGAAFKATVGLDALVGRQGFLSLSGGLISAPAGSFRAWILAVEGGRRFALGTTTGPVAPADWDWSWSGWAFRPSFLRLASAQRQGTGPALPIELVGLAFSHDLGHGFEMVGQGNFATAGKAGGFAQGLVGLAWRSPSLLGRGPRLRVQGLLGEAGGGGVDTSGGFLLQPSVGLEQDLGAGWCAQALWGRSRAPRGKLDSSLIEGGLAWRFHLPTRP